MIALAPLPETMPAAVLEGPGRLAVREIPIWPVERYGDPDLVLLEVEACGVCGSDYRYFAGENPWAQHTLGRFVPNPPNIVLGHEYAGRVVAVASQANRHWLGKRVAAICSKVCGACVDCSAGREHLCAHTVHLGHGQGWGERDFYSGAYARYTLAWGSGSYELPEDVPYEEAAMLDILAVAVHIARVGNVGHGSRVLCIGAGPAGNAVAQAARAMGAHEVWLTDPSEDALAIAQTQGFASPSSLPRMERAVAMRPGPGGGNSPRFDAVIDTVGLSDTIEAGLDLLEKRGTFVNVAVHDAQVTFNPSWIGAERRFTTSCNFERSDFEQAAAWLADGNFQVSEWLTPIALSDLPHLFGQTASEGKRAFKLVVTRFE